jgi:hypothetical protein
MKSQVVRWTLGAALVLAVGIPLGARAVADRKREQAELDRLRALAEQLAPLGRRAKTGQRVILNGQPTFFGVSTADGDVRANLDRIRGECEKGDLGVRLEETHRRDGDRGDPAPLTLTRVERQEAEGEGEAVGATLCVFRTSEGAGRDEASRRRVRYTLAHRLPDGRTSLFTIATECGAPIEALFPAEGDAPGADLTGVPRPAEARRTFSATIEHAAYSVHVYEVARPVAAVVDSYDVTMKEAGWLRSEAVAKEMPRARMYHRGEVEVVASFEDAEGGGTSVALAPFTDS